MSARLRLLLDDGGLSVWSLGGREMHQLTTFPNNASGVEAFSRFANAQRTTQAYLLIDNNGQQLATETLPKAGRRLFSRMLETRLQRLYPDTAWRCAMPLPTSAGTERGVVFLGQAQTAALHAWENCLNAQTRLAVQRACCSPMLLAPFIRKQGHRADQLIVVRQHGPGAIQLCRLQHGQPVALHTVQPNAVGDVAEMLSRFARLPINGHHPPENRRVCLIGDSDWQAGIALPDDPLRIITRHANSALDLLCLDDRHWPTCFAQPAASQRKLARYYGLVAIAAGVAALSAGTAVMARHLTWQEKLEAGKAQHQQLTLAIKQLEQHALAAGIAARHLDLLPRDRLRLLAHRDDFSTALLALSRAMDNLPGFSLEKLGWESLSDPVSSEGKWRMTLGGQFASQGDEAFRKFQLDRLQAAAGANGEIRVQQEERAP